jgi:hypothetical protein
MSFLFNVNSMQALAWYTLLPSAASVPAVRRRVRYARELRMNF